MLIVSLRFDKKDIFFSKESNRNIRVFFSHSIRGFSVADYLCFVSQKIFFYLDR